MRTSEIMLLLRARGFVFDRALGQHFLADDQVLQEIIDASELAQGARVLEIGPGAGTMTTYLCKAGASVLAVEVDRTLLGVLDAVLTGLRGARVVHADILKADIAALAQEAWGDECFDVISNLPYQITTPVLTRLLNEDLPIRNMTLMMQKEAAERLCATPGHRNYGPLAILAAYRAHIRDVVEVLPDSFVPPPHVDSRVVRVQMLPRALSPDREERLFSLVRRSFAMRRKTLRNNLQALVSDREALDGMLSACGLTHNARAEEVSLEQYMQLEQSISART